MKEKLDKEPKINLTNVPKKDTNKKKTKQFKNLELPFCLSLGLFLRTDDIFHGFTK